MTVGNSSFALPGGGAHITYLKLGSGGGSGFRQDGRGWGDDARPLEPSPPTASTNSGLARLRVWRFFTLVLVALSMGASFSHVLEMPAKLRWAGPLYVAVQNEPPGLYQAFGTIGAVIEVAALVATLGLACLAWGRQLAGRLSVVGAGLLVIALICWVVLIAPANSVMAAWTPETVPPDWTRWRDRWELTHAVGFGLKLASFSILLASVVIETPLSTRPRRDPNTPGYAASGS